MFHFIFPSFNFNIEHWKWSDEYRVYVSNKGHFKDEYKKNLPIRINSGGYVSVRTSCGYILAHRLVLKVWRPVPDSERLTVDHLDHNKRNNSVDNLEWVSKEENLRRARKDLLPSKENFKMMISENKNPFLSGDYSSVKIRCVRTNTIFNNPRAAAENLLRQIQKNGGSVIKEETLFKIEKRIVKAAKNNTSYNCSFWEFC